MMASICSPAGSRKLLAVVMVAWCLVMVVAALRFVALMADHETGAPASEMRQR